MAPGRGAEEPQRQLTLIPAGFGVGMPEVTDDVWMDFADTAYMKWVLAIPDLSGSHVRIASRRSAGNRPRL